MRRSLVARLLVAIVAVTIIAVLGTVWLAQNIRPTYSLSRATTNQATDLAISQELMRWAGSHPSWAGAEPLVDELSREYNRRIAIVEAGTILIDTRPELPRPDFARSILDPWEELRNRIRLSGTPDDLVTPGTPLPPYIVGALALTVDERAALARQATAVADCLGQAPEETVRLWPTGRPVLALDPPPENCGVLELRAPLPSEAKTLDALTALTNACLIAEQEPAIAHVGLNPVASNEPGILLAIAEETGGLRDPTPGSQQRCLDGAFIDISSDYVSPPVDVFITDDRGDQRGITDLTPGSMARILLVALAVVGLVIATAWFVGAPAVRQVQAITGAARRLARGEATGPVPVLGTDEVADLAVAFNTMAADLEHSRNQQRQMTSDIAHELRTPLTTLRGWLEGAQDGVIPTDRRLVDLLHTETMHLQHIAGDLHTLTRAESGQLHVHRGQIDLSTILREAVEGAQVRTAKTGIAITIDVEDFLVVQGDGERLRQVLDNLIGNALIHSGGTRIGVRGHRAKAQVVVEVSDDGPGIDPEDLPHLFDRFWRADQSRARESGGSGLGLAITRKLVEAHFGTIRATSSASAGTTFTVTIPSHE